MHSIDEDKDEEDDMPSPLTPPSNIWHMFSSTVEPAYKVYGYKVFSDVRSIFSWSQSESAILSHNLDVRSAGL